MSASEMEIQVEQIRSQYEEKQPTDLNKRKNEYAPKIMELSEKALKG